jgi:hypothetical protein
MNDWQTLLAIILGPLSAVVVTLIFEQTRRTKDRRLVILRMLLATRHMPADAQYNVAINLIPAEFNSQAEVMEAWRKYHTLVRERPAAEGQSDHQRRISVAQAALIYRMMLSTGLKLSEGDIQTEAYVSQGFVERDAIYQASLKALPELADAMKAQVKHTERLLAMVAAARGGGSGPAPGPTEVPDR